MHSQHTRASPPAPTHPPALVLLMQRLGDGLEEGEEGEAVAEHVVRADDERRRLAPREARAQLLLLAALV